MTFPAIQSVSVLLPTYQGLEFLDRVLDALRAQDLALPWDLLVADSDSSDGTVERILERSPELGVIVRVLRIRGAEFDHGDTRNLLACRSRGDLLVYLTQDAIPSKAGWLTELVAIFEDQGVGAVSCRNVPRSDASLSARVFCYDDPGYALRSKRRELPREPEVLTPDGRRALYDFQNVASAVRRAVWERHPFPRTMMGEDVLMARGVVEGGWSTLFSAEATVDHSHDYGADKLRWRGTVDARFNAEWLDRITVREASDQPVLVERMALRDAEILAEIAPEKAAEAATLQELRELRAALVEGLYAGGKSMKRYAQSQVLGSGKLRVLLVSDALMDASGEASWFARDYAPQLGRELLDRGHDVRLALLDPGLAGSAWVENQAGGVRAFRHGGDAGLKAALAESGGEWLPDVTHALCSTRRSVGALEETVLGNRPSIASLLSAAALPPKGTPMHRLLARVDRVVVPSVSMRDALMGGALDQHRLELSVPGVLCDLPARLRGASSASAARRVVVVGRASWLGGEILSALTARYSVDDLAWGEGTSLADRIEKIAEAGCIVIVGELDSVAALDAALVARAAGVRCVVAADSVAAEASWHDDGVLSVEWSRSSVLEAVAEAVEQRRSGLSGLRRVDVPIKRLYEDAADMEVRYRVLASIDRTDPRGHATVLGSSGERLEREGETLIQGGGRLVLFPGASAKLSLAGIDGPVWIRVTQTALAGEDLVLDGEILVDGRSIGRLERRAPVMKTQVFEDTLSVRLAPGARFLELRPHEHMRVDSVAIERRGISSPGSPTTDDESSSRASRPSLLEICQRLAVPAPPELPESLLPSVALVIPTLEGRDLVRSCLRSLQDVRYPAGRLQLVIVDNGSTDGTADWVRSGYPSARVVREEHNLGFAAACNRGAAAAVDAEVLVFVNNDMRFDARFLIELVAPIAHGACDATTAKRLSWDGTKLDGAGVGSNLVGIAVQPGFGEPVGPEHEIRRRTLFPCGGAMAMRASVFRGLGGFDEDFFAYYEDLDLGWRAWVAGYSVHYVPTAVCEHHHSHTSRRFAPERVRRMVIRNSLLACLKNYDDANLAKVLPVMTALAVSRAFLKSGLDPAAFDPPGQGAGPAQEGTAQVGLSDVGEAPEPQTYAIDGIGAADLVALHDVFGRWSEVMAKRSSVQEMRRREDSEIFAMFLDPLACVEGDPGYVDLQSGLVRWLGLETLFDQDASDAQV
ncbi:MAG: glycosyltransferase, partial [Planctomycetota bacterium]